VTREKGRETGNYTFVCDNKLLIKFGKWWKRKDLNEKSTPFIMMGGKHGARVWGDGG
jgi:hypothetical protein